MFSNISYSFQLHSPSRVVSMFLRLNVFAEQHFRKPAGRTLFVCSDGDRTFCLFLHHRSCMWISLVILTMRLRVILLLYLQGNSTKLPLFLAACSLEADVELALSLSVDLSSVVGRQMWIIRTRVFGKVLIKSCILSKDGCRSARFLPDLWLRLL